MVYEISLHLFRVLALSAKCEKLILSILVIEGLGHHYLVSCITLHIVLPHALFLRCQEHGAILLERDLLL